MVIDIYNTTKKYKTLYADPPWLEQGGGKIKRGADKHYPTMEKSTIQAFPIKQLSNRDSVLLLWVTAPCLIEGFELIEKWGFTYKTVAFTWIKQCRKSDKIFTGMGYYTRSNAEFCLLATKGKILERNSRAVSSVVVSHIEEHSDEVRRRIVELFGDRPRIELSQGNTLWVGIAGATKFEKGDANKTTIID